MQANSIYFILLWYSVRQVIAGEVAESFSNLTDITNCTLIPRNTHITGELKKLIDEGNRNIIINVELSGELGPFGEHYPGGLFEPNKWILITEEAGKSLLLFPDDHVAKSLYTLSFGVSSFEITLDQQPQNCFNRSYSLDQILNTIRFYVLRNFSEDGSKVPDSFEVCNRQVILEDDNTTAELRYICCNDLLKLCYILKPGKWLNTLNICLFILKFVVPFLCPLFIPKKQLKTFLIFCYTPVRCNEMLPKLLVKKIESSPNPDRYNLIEMSLPKFESFLRTKATKGSNSLEIKSILFEAREDKLIEEGSHPYGLWNFLFGTFVECQMRKEDSDFNECCNQNICKPLTCWYVSWIQFLKCIMYLILFAVLASPWWFTVIFYYSYDYQFVEDIESASTDLNVQISSPLESFTWDYLMIGAAFLFFIKYNVSSDEFRSSIKTLFYVCIYGKNDVSQAMSTFLKVLLIPFQQCGLFIGCVVFGLWAVLVVPFLILRLIFQILPLVNIFSNFYLLYQELQEQHNVVKLNVTYTVLLCFIVIYIFLFIVTGCVIFYIDVFVYVMIGLLLNYDYVFKYIILLLLFLVYGYDCFNNVHKRYSYFSTLLSRKLQGKIVNQFDLSYQNDANDEMNTAHAVSTFSDKQADKLNFTCFARDCLYWRAKRLVFFLDRSEAIPAPYVSKQFFKDMNSIKNLACPGSQYILYLKALRDLIIVVIFLLFVIIVVFALGRAHDLSSGVQTLVALGGGFLPFMFEKFISKSKKDMKFIENCFWENLIENRIDHFEEQWKVKDIEIEDPRTCKAATDIPVTGSIQDEMSDSDNFDFVVSETTREGKQILRIFVPNRTWYKDRDSEMVVQSSAKYQSLH